MKSHIKAKTPQKAENQGGATAMGLCEKRDIYTERKNRKIAIQLNYPPLVQAPPMYGKVVLAPGGGAWTGGG